MVRRVKRVHDWHIVNTNFEPFPGSLSTVMFPPCSSTIPLRWRDRARSSGKLLLARLDLSNHFTPALEARRFHIQVFLIQFPKDTAGDAGPEPAKFDG